MTRVYYTKGYRVSFLRELLQEWIRRDSFYEFRGRIVDAIQGHNENDMVSPRLDDERQVKLFEVVAQR